MGYQSRARIIVENGTSQTKKPARYIKYHTLGYWFFKFGSRRGEAYIRPLAKNPKGKLAIKKAKKERVQKLKMSRLIEQVGAALNAEN